MQPGRTDNGQRVPAYAAILPLPCAALGLRLAQGRLTGIDFLPPDTPPLAPLDPLSAQAAMQIQAYLRNPRHRFDLPVRLEGTPFRLRVWAALATIPAGQTRTYGELAGSLGTSARAVGQALGDNPLPIIVPCHRVVARTGLGGFDHHAGGFALTVKQWLLRHEQAC